MIRPIESSFVFLCFDLTTKWGVGEEKLVTSMLSYHTLSITSLKEKKAKKALTPNCKTHFKTYEAFLFCVVGIISY